MKKEKNKKVESVRMSYKTYAYLKSLVNFDIERWKRDFQTACTFIPESQSSGIDKAHKIFTEEYSRLKRIENELFVVSQQTYKDHPDEETRKFWGIL